ncbi:thioredoxin family protein [uncultured Ezakiella sp.]|uniref:thioredoxin TrxA n=1 Tax=uncultured Ezakiella sp. TaxID=1637529 RepID=UPI0025E7CE65|nr:thioredoxin family protein [uncultured Ezakiella sp.]
MLELTKENFDQEVKEAEGYVLVDFWSQSCEPCKALMPHVHDMEKDFENIKFTSFDIGLGRRLAIREKVMGLPVIAIYKDGERVDAVTTDDATKENVRAMLEKYA